jgi:hypothetical protein
VRWRYSETALSLVHIPESAEASDTTMKRYLHEWDEVIQTPLSHWLYTIFRLPKHLIPPQRIVESGEIRVVEIGYLSR